MTSQLRSYCDVKSSGLPKALTSGLLLPAPEVVGSLINSRKAWHAVGGRVRVSVSGQDLVRVVWAFGHLAREAKVPREARLDDARAQRVLIFKVRGREVGGGHGVA